jgi:hypothetical protein
MPSTVPVSIANCPKLPWRNHIARGASDPVSTKAWSKGKEAVRRARPRTADELIVVVGAALQAITTDDVRGWLTHCGYHTDS